jgi:CubicO group peptidase (beta-lactamase class C family)
MCLALLSALIPLIAQAPASLPSRLQAIMRDFDAEGFSGVVLVERKGAVEFLQAYGYADRRRKIRNTPDTRFEMASLTKPFTSAAILKLQEQGKLRTSDRLDRYIGPLPPPKNLATIHHLALHQAGLVVRGTSPPGDSREAFLQGIRTSPAESKPGEKYRYTNAGYGVMGAIIEIVSGTSYNDFVRQAILLPLGLREAYFRDETVPNLALGYRKPPDDPEPTSSAKPVAWDHGAAGLMISVPDLHMAFKGLRSGKVLSQASLGIMFHPWPEEGYGWHVRKDAAGRRLIEKSGGAPSYASHLFHYPDDQVTIIWATNSLHKRFRPDLNRRLCEAVLGATVPK